MSWPRRCCVVTALDGRYATGVHAPALAELVAADIACRYGACATVSLINVIGDLATVTLRGASATHGEYRVRVANELVTLGRYIEAPPPLPSLNAGGGSG